MKKSILSLLLLVAASTIAQEAIVTNTIFLAVPHTAQNIQGMRFIVENEGPHHIDITANVVNNDPRPRTISIQTMKNNTMVNEFSQPLAGRQSATFNHTFKVDVAIDDIITFKAKGSSSNIKLEPNRNSNTPSFKASLIPDKPSIKL